MTIDEIDQNNCHKKENIKQRKTKEPNVKETVAK